MNTGEGILLRTVAHAAGSTTTTPAAASTGFCSACAGQAARPSSLRTVCRTCHYTALSQPSSNHVDLEDWEFADEAFSDISANRPLPSSSALLFSHSPSVSSHPSAYLAEEAAPFENQFWHVFGLPPSIEEANAATSELQAALFSSDSVSPPFSATPSEYEAPLTHQESDEEKADAGGEWVEPQLFASQAVVAKSPVEEAFQLLRSDANVKGAVISIVSDPDVWHAMMKNEKVQELKRMFQKSQERGEAEGQEQQSSKSDKHNCLDGVSFLLRSIVGLSRQVVWQVQDDITKIFMSIFSLMTGPKVRGGKEEDPLERTMKSSMMIAVVVVTLVVMKRMQV